MRGGTNQERLYLRNSFELGIKQTDMPNMPDLIARHRARYHLGAFLARPGMKVLDFPCGSGYGSELFENVDYHGADNDGPSVEFAKLHYKGTFFKGNLKKPYEIPHNTYDLIMCVEGLEHIEKEYQEPLIGQFKSALVPGGKLLVTMPEAAKESGANPDNPYHLHELTFNDFDDLLMDHFFNVQIICYEDVSHNGIKTNFMCGICQKEGE